MSQHFHDNKLHVVAAPGAGKTILGIEVMIRLGSAALIMTPTVAIRDQWRKRMIDHFWPDGEEADWISTDVKRLSEITISTYQGLHALCRDIGERERFVRKLKD